MQDALYTSSNYWWRAFLVLYAFLMVIINPVFPPQLNSINLVHCVWFILCRRVLLRMVLQCSHTHRYNISCGRHPTWNVETRCIKYLHYHIHCTKNMAWLHEELMELDVLRMKIRTGLSGDCYGKQRVSDKATSCSRLCYWGRTLRVCEKLIILE